VPAESRDHVRPASQQRAQDRPSIRAILRRRRAAAAAGARPRLRDLGDADIGHFCSRAPIDTAPGRSSTIRSIPVRQAHGRHATHRVLNCARSPEGAQPIDQTNGRLAADDGPKRTECGARSRREALKQSFQHRRRPDDSRRRRPSASSFAA
jgi:hypothetical protein